MTPDTTAILFATVTLLIGAVVRLLKSDTPLPTVPPRWRASLAIALGVAGGVVEALSVGTPWREAIIKGVAAGMTAIVGHDVLIEGARGGREVGGDADAVKTPRPRGLTRIEVMAGAMTVGMLGAALAGFGCAGWKREAKSVIDTATAVCVLANGMSTNAEIMAICGIEQSLAPVVDAILSEHRAQLKASALRVCK